MILHLYIAFTRVLTISETRETVEKIKAEEEECTLGNANRQPAVVPRCTGMSLGLVKDSRITETAADATH